MGKIIEMNVQVVKVKVEVGEVLVVKLIVEDAIGIGCVGFIRADTCSFSSPCPVSFR